MPRFSNFFQRTETQQEDRRNQALQREIDDIVQTCGGRIRAESHVRVRTEHQRNLKVDYLVYVFPTRDFYKGEASDSPAKREFIMEDNVLQDRFRELLVKRFGQEPALEYKPGEHHFRVKDASPEDIGKKVHEKPARVEARKGITTWWVLDERDEK